MLAQRWALAALCKHDETQLGERVKANSHLQEYSTRTYGQHRRDKTRSRLQHGLQLIDSLHDPWFSNFVKREQAAFFSL